MNLQWTHQPSATLRCFARGWTGGGRVYLARAKMLYIDIGSLWQREVIKTITTGSTTRQLRMENSAIAALKTMHGSAVAVYVTIN